MIVKQMDRLQLYSREEEEISAQNMATQETFFILHQSLLTGKYEGRAPKVSDGLIAFRCFFHKKIRSN